MAPKQATYGEVTMEKGDDHVATVEFHRPPNNFFDVDLVRCLGDALEDLEPDLDVRAIVLCSEGKHFLRRRANFGGGDRTSAAGAEPRPDGTNPRTPRPSGCFRTSVCPSSRRCRAPRSAAASAWPARRLPGRRARGAVRRQLRPPGLPPGVRPAVTLPYVVGNQKALELLYTGRRSPVSRPSPSGWPTAWRRWTPCGTKRGPWPREIAVRLPLGPPGRPQDHAGRPRRRRGQGHRARVHRAGQAAADQGLHRGHPRLRRAPRTPVHRRVGE